MKDVLIIMGSDSDLPVMKEAAMVLDALNITYHLKDIARIINEYHPDIRKIINVTQQNTINNELTLTKVNTKFDITDVISLIQGKDAFKSVRQYLVDNNISDFEPMYRALYDELGKDNGLITMTLAEYQFKHSTVTDKEINFMGCIAKLTTI